MEKFLKAFEYKNERYTIMLVKYQDKPYAIKDFKEGFPFSPFFYCISDLGLIDMEKIDSSHDQPALNFLITLAEDGARYWADHKYMVLETYVGAL